jgi:hypothetical protein
MLTRRRLLQGGLAAAAATAIARGHAVAGATTVPSSTPIDRRAVVSRHHVVRTQSNPRSPLQVGNGTIAFGADITGLQTFVPFNTLSQWGWYSAPLPAGETVADMADTMFPGRNREIPYDSGDRRHPDITKWVFSNPSRINLGRIGLKLVKADGKPASESDLTEVRQELNLWTGTLVSRFKLEDQPVSVTTACHLDRDAVAVRVESPAVAAGRISAYLDFPAPDDRQFADYVGSSSAAFPVKIQAESSDRLDLLRQLHQDHYHVAIVCSAGTRSHTPDGTAPVIVVKSARYGADNEWLDVTAAVAGLLGKGETAITADNNTFGSDPALKKHKRMEIAYSVNAVPHSDRVNENETWTPNLIGGPNSFRLTSQTNVLEFVVAFSPEQIAVDLPNALAIFSASSTGWPAFWQSGGAIDLSASADPRWKELERRVVLSQYLMAVNEAGKLPPQESGLVNNGWFGKYHMEMYWWHAAHYALWNRWPLLEPSLDIYSRMLPSAKARAEHQGFKGARWTKMTGPDFRNSAFITNALLIWQQPHPMFFAELQYRYQPNQATLERWQTVLFAAADFMASFADLDAKTQKYDLGPSMAVVSENTDDKITTNPTFELSYWRFGLRIAQTWRERLGMPRDENWDRVLNNLAPLPVEDGVYVTYEGIPQMWSHYNFEHPALTGVFGWLPGDGVDLNVMRATFERVQAKWKMNRVWGWDFPMMAMCAARLGEPEKAIDLLLTPGDHFSFDDAGLAGGGPYPYFPSNGGLLYAIAMMSAGWDGSTPGKTAPGFPTNGQWVVRSEGLSPAI